MAHRPQQRRVSRAAPPSPQLLLLVAAAAAASLALLTPGAAAQRSSCPSAVCNSYFANAMGGPVDCCNHDFSKSSNCRWAGTPVSFDYVRSCEDSAKAYKVLSQSNFQGPPGSRECRCSSPDGGAGAVAPAGLKPMQMCVELQPRPDTDIQGQDVPCNGASFCKVCGGAEEVRKACASSAGCVAFTFSPAEGCGYLKSGASAAKGRSGWVAFTR